MIPEWTDLGIRITCMRVSAWRCWTRSVFPRRGNSQLTCTPFQAFSAADCAHGWQPRSLPPNAGSLLLSLHGVVLGSLKWRLWAFAFLPCMGRSQSYRLSRVSVDAAHCYCFTLVSLPRQTYQVTTGKGGVMALLGDVQSTLTAQ